LTIHYLQLQETRKTRFFIVRDRSQGIWRTPAAPGDVDLVVGDDRLDLLHIHLPPLRQRREDIPVLARFFFERAVNS
jgi:hypothetical protein